MAIPIMAVSLHSAPFPSLESLARVCAGMGHFDDISDREMQDQLWHSFDGDFEILIF